MIVVDAATNTLAELDDDFHVISSTKAFDEIWAKRPSKLPLRFPQQNNRSTIAMGIMEIDDSDPAYYAALLDWLHEFNLSLE